MRIETLPRHNLFLAVLVTVLLAGQALSQECTWTSAGPTNVNGRITSIAINPRDHMQIFVTSVGGVWRSDDGGRRWKRLSDEFIHEARVASSVVINPEHPNQIFVGGGDPNRRVNGGGIWSSDDCGENWRKISDAHLDATVIMRLRMGPTSPDPRSPYDLYAATMSGVWVRDAMSHEWILLAGFNAPVSDMVVDLAASPAIVYVGVLEDRGLFTRGIWKYDRKWTQRDTGIKRVDIGHVALAMAETNHRTLYAKIANRSGGLLGVYKTITGADDWTAVPGITGSYQTDYNNVIEVDPADESIVWAGDPNCWRLDSSGTWTPVNWSPDRSYGGLHADDHAIAFDPRNSKIVFIGTDGGLFRSSDTSKPDWHWSNISHGMVITEFYSVASQQARATMVVGGTQDSGVNFTYGNRAWYNSAACDGNINGVAVDAENSTTIYQVNTCPGRNFGVTRNPIPYAEGDHGSLPLDLESDVMMPFSPLATDVTLRGRALASGMLRADATHPEGGNQLLRTIDDTGTRWRKIGDRTPVDAIKTVAIAPSSSFRTYYAGLYISDAATIWRYFDEGGPVLRLEKTNIGIPPNREPTSLAVDYTRANRVFATIGLYGSGDVLLTTDADARGPAHWRSMRGTGTTALPSTSVYGIVIDPSDPDIVYVATGIGVYKGQITKSGASWEPFNNVGPEKKGIPDGVDVRGIWVNTVTKTLYVGTMGYGVYQRDIRPGATCAPIMLVVRDNVLDRGTELSNDLPDPEHPIPDPSRPGGYKPNDTASGRLYWWQSNDIRIYVPSVSPIPNRLTNVDSVEFESCPLEKARCDPETLIDSFARRGEPATAYVQVTNRGINPARNVRVILLRTDEATTGLPDLPEDFWSRTFPDLSRPCGPLTPGSGWSAVDPVSPCGTIEKIEPIMPEVVGFRWDVSPTANEHTCMIALVESIDDPIPLDLRARNERRIWVLAPENRQIAVRNLHVVNPSSDGEATRGSDALTVPNFDRLDQRPIDLYLSKAGMPVKGKLAILLPRMSSVSLRGIKRMRANLSNKDQMKFKTLGLDVSIAYQLIDQEGVIQNLRIPPGKTWKIGLVYDTVTRGRPNSAARFTVLERQGTKLLGGSTYILRHRGK